jgi:O-methyltransferase involved in polyketide biosynthesis
MTLRITERHRQGGGGAGSAPAEPEFDPSIPNVARIYDFMLGGKDNFTADRAAAERVVEQVPHSALACRQNRDFLGRVVRSLADAGIRQFLDIGSGLPTRSNVHEIAQAAAPASRVVYVDYDPVVIGHARALLASGADGVMVVEGDLRDPGKIIGEAQGLLDFSEPVAVLLFAILHFLTDDDQPCEIVRRLTEPLAPSSALSVSHITADGTDPERSQAAQEVYQGASARAIPRSREGITRFFDGLDLLKPGVVDINHWPVKAAAPAAPVAPLTFYGGTATKP